MQIIDPSSLGGLTSCIFRSLAQTASQSQHCLIVARSQPFQGLLSANPLALFWEALGAGQRPRWTRTYHSSGRRLNESRSNRAGRGKKGRSEWSRMPAKPEPGFHAKEKGEKTRKNKRKQKNMSDETGDGMTTSLLDFGVFCNKRIFSPDTSGTFPMGKPISFLLALVWLSEIYGTVRSAVPRMCLRRSSSSDIAPA